MAANEYQQVWRLASSASRRGVLQLSQHENQLKGVGIEFEFESIQK